MSLRYPLGGRGPVGTDPFRPPRTRCYRFGLWGATGAAASAVVTFGVIQGHTADREKPAQDEIYSTALIAPISSAAVDEDTGQVVVAGAVPGWDDASRASAMRAGAGVIQRFAQPSVVDERRWWSLLEPLLTPRARLDFAGVDPRNVPVRGVVGSARLIDETSAYVAKVEVPTDAGKYLVVLSRPTAGAGWLAEDLVPPDRRP